MGIGTAWDGDEVELVESDGGSGSESTGKAEAEEREPMTSLGIS